MPAALPSSPVLLIGAGPAGLCLAVALARQGIACRVLDTQSRAALGAPAEDGRDIALTHRARGILEELGLWQRLPADVIAPLRGARVHDGGTPVALPFDAPPRTPDGTLGWLVPNHHLRQAAWDAASSAAGIEIVPESPVVALALEADAARVRLPDGRSFEAELVVAADSRYSATRRMAGIGADWLDFGRTAIVCRMAHERPHEDIAHECFDYGLTLAMLPMCGREVSAVLTLPSNDLAAWLDLAPEAFAQRIQERFGPALGALRLAGPRHSYPLVATYAHSFVGHRIALLGDAAVGMHPVTAHGFNFGLYGVQVLARALADARRRGQGVASASALAAYDREHRRVTRPIYLGTNAIVRLFTDERGPARVARRAVIEIARRLPPVHAFVTRQLTGGARAV